MKLYQSFLGEDQKALLSKHAIPYDVSDNRGLDQREYELFKTIHKQYNHGAEPWGLVSWKFQYKTPVTPESFLNFANTMFEEECDCVFINPMIGNEAVFLNVWEQWTIVNKKTVKISDFLKKHNACNIFSPMGNASFAFCNYFIANDAFWKSYFSFIDQTLEKFELEAILGSEVGLIYKESASYAGDPYLTMRPFIIERLFSSYILNNPSIKCASFPFRVEHYEHKFGHRLGQTLHKMATLKNEWLQTGNQSLFQRWNQLRYSLLNTSALRAVIFNLDDPSPLLLSPDYSALVSTLSI